jgi:DNA-binding transcriptional regulator/RsmH inhibitor MraZ
MGMLTGRVDDKGRLKLPTDLIEYFNKLPEKTLYVTSLDGVMGQLYRKSVWLENEKFFQSYRQKPKLTKDVGFLAAAMGAPVEMDGQGRVQLPVKLRKQLGLEEGVVHVYAYKGRIQILSEVVYQQKFGAALSGSEDKVDELEAEGLQ